MTFANPTERDTLSLGGYCYGQQLESKTRFICGFSQIVINTCGHHTTSNKRATYGRNHRGALICYLSSRIPNPLDRCKLWFTALAQVVLNYSQFVRTSVRIPRLQSHEIGTIMMLLANSTYEKSAQQLALAGTLITHSTSEVRMSLFPCILAQSESAGYEQALNVRGLS